jgi:hypothetical protein
MKKKLLYTAIISFGLFMTSCQESHDIDFVDLGSEFFISDNGITSLDSKTTLTFKNDQKNLTSVEAFIGEKSYGKADFSDGVGSLDVELLTGPKSTVGEEFDFVCKSSNGGKAIQRMHSVEVADAVSYSITGDLYEYKSDADTVFIKVETSSAKIVSVVFEGAKNKNPYSPVTVEDEKLEETSYTGYIELPTDLVAGDSLLAKVTASAKNSNGDVTQTTEFVLYVGAKSFDYSAGGSLDNAESDYYLYTNKIDEKEVNLGLISYSETTSGSVAYPGFNSTGVKFLKIDNPKTQVSNLSEAVTFFKTGSPVAGYDKVTADDRFVYHFTDKVGKDDVEFYGVMTISELSHPIVGDPSVSFTFTNTSTTKN